MLLAVQLAVVPNAAAELPPAPAAALPELPPVWKAPPAARFVVLQSAEPDDSPASALLDAHFVPEVHTDDSAQSAGWPAGLALAGSPSQDSFLGECLAGKEWAGRSAPAAECDWFLPAYSPESHSRAFLLGRSCRSVWADLA